MKTTWESPSNIALVKYWGKYEPQLPANPSVSFTLSACATQTTVEATPIAQPTGAFVFDVLLDGKPEPGFAPKIEGFLKRIQHLLPWLPEYQYTIRTSNSFPHSSGIASSASGMSALALCLVGFHKQLGFDVPGTDYQFASILARLGSGSAARSVYGGLVVWGHHTEVPNSSDEYAVPLQLPVHDVFKTYQDVVLLVEKGKKQTSSTAGHGLMVGHPFAERRFQHASEQLSRLLAILKAGDTEAFSHLIEAEALELHAMMMTSNPYFMLMKPNTLSILEHIWAFRRDTGIQASFTLDAGANVHLLFPEAAKHSVMDLVTSKLVAYCKEGAYICDQVGNGPKKY